MLRTRAKRNLIRSKHFIIVNHQRRDKRRDWFSALLARRYALAQASLWLHSIYKVSKQDFDVR